MVILVVALVPLSTLSVVVADASRAPTREERKAIKRAAMRNCAPQEATGYQCIWRGHVRVSTRDPRYAYARVSGPAYDSSGILRRRHRNSSNWRMVHVVGGGIQSCEQWYRNAPRRVVREFKIRGFTEGDQSFSYHRC